MRKPEQGNEYCVFWLVFEQSRDGFLRREMKATISCLHPVEFLCCVEESWVCKLASALNPVTRAFQLESDPSLDFTDLESRFLCLNTSSGVEKLIVSPLIFPKLSSNLPTCPKLGYIFRPGRTATVPIPNNLNYKKSLKILNSTLNIRGFDIRGFNIRGSRSQHSRAKADF